MILLTIIGQVKNLICGGSKGPKMDLLKSALGNHSSNAAFLEYAMTEFAGENILAWNQIQKFKQMSNEAEKIALARSIYHDFLNGKSSALEVNVPLTIVSVAKEKLDSENVETNIFDPIAFELVQNMIDTFSRYQYSAGYVRMQAQKKMVDNALDIPLLTIIEQEKK